MYRASVLCMYVYLSPRIMEPWYIILKYGIATPNLGASALVGSRSMESAYL